MLYLMKPSSLIHYILCLSITLHPHLCLCLFPIKLMCLRTLPICNLTILPLAHLLPHVFLLSADTTHHPPIAVSTGADPIQAPTSSPVVAPATQAALMTDVAS